MKWQHATRHVIWRIWLALEASVHFIGHWRHVTKFKSVLRESARHRAWY